MQFTSLSKVKKLKIILSTELLLTMTSLHQRKEFLSELLIPTSETIKSLKTQKLLFPQLLLILMLPMAMKLLI